MSQQNMDTQYQTVKKEGEIPEHEINDGTILYVPVYTFPEEYQIMLPAELEDDEQPGS